jgi:hypothetical protein
MKKRKDRQLELPLPRVCASERKAWIQHRLAGYEYRQRARERTRQLSYQRRRQREAGLLEDKPAPEQLNFPPPPTEAKREHAGIPEQLSLPMVPRW